MRAEDVIPPSPQTDSTLIGAHEDNTRIDRETQSLGIILQ